MGRIGRCYPRHAEIALPHPTRRMLFLDRSALRRRRLPRLLAALAVLGLAALAATAGA